MLQFPTSLEKDNSFLKILKGKRYHIGLKHC